MTQVVALVLMVWIGWFGGNELLWRADREESIKKSIMYKWLGWLWMVAWCGPPLLVLWIEGVMG